MTLFETRLEAVLEIWTARDALTRTERDVLRRAAYGMSVQAIARERGCAAKTIAKHVENVLFKTGERSLARAVTRLLREAFGLAA